MSDTNRSHDWRDDDHPEVLRERMEQLMGELTDLIELFRRARHQGVVDLVNEVGEEFNRNYGGEGSDE
jgi:adenylate kinase family enzyme